MENYIILDGKKFEMEDSLVELLRGVVKEEVEKEKEKSPFTRVSKGENFWYISIVGTPTLVQILVIKLTIVVIIQPITVRIKN